MLAPGQAVDRYTVDSVLGRGGMAVVYRVRHNQLGSLHALKVLTLTSPGIRDRLLQEGRLQASLRHPNVVAVTDVIQVEDAPGLVMEYVDGSSLDLWLKEHRPSLEEAERLFRGIVEAVAHAHDQGLVHRDLKPANVMLARAGDGFVPKVADFGLAKAFVEEGSGLQQTRSGVAMGTPAYMAPEQIRDAKNVDHRADLFSLGCILFELVCGRPPFVGPDVLAIFNAVASASFPPPSSLVPDIPARFQDAILGCLAVDREQRIPDCRSLLAVLEGRTSRPATSAPPPPSPQQTWSASMLGAEGLQGAVPATSTQASEIAEPSGMDGTLPPSSGTSLETGRSRGGRGLLALGLGGMLLAGGGVLGLGAIVAGVLWMTASWGARIDQDLSTLTGGEVRLSGVDIRPHALRLDDLEVIGRDGRPVLTADAVHLEGRTGTLRGTSWDLEEVRFERLRIDLRRDDQGWILPDQTVALLRQDAPSAAIGAIRTGAVELTVHHASGTTRLRWDDLDLDTVSVPAGDATGWTADALGLQDLVVEAGDRVLALRALDVTAASARGEGLDLWIRGRTDGYLDLAPLFAPHVPFWLGGTAAEDVPWFGVDTGLLPIRPARLEVGSGTVHLVDRSNSAGTVQWEVALDRLHVGPLTGDRLPVALGGRVGDGRVAVELDLSPDGALRGSVRARYLPLDRLEPYLAPSLRHHGVAIAGGLLSADFDLVQEGRALAARFEAEVQDAAFEAEGTVSGRSRRLLRDRSSVKASHAPAGSVADPSFTPVHDAIRAVGDALFAPGGGAVWESRVVASTPAPPPRRLRSRRSAPPPGVQPVEVEEPTVEATEAAADAEPELEAEAEPELSPAEEEKRLKEELDRAKGGLRKLERGVRGILDDAGIRTGDGGE